MEPHLFSKPSVDFGMLLNYTLADTWQHIVSRSNRYANVHIALRVAGGEIKLGLNNATVYWTQRTLAQSLVEQVLLLAS